MKITIEQVEEGWLVRFESHPFVTKGFICAGWKEVIKKLNENKKEMRGGGRCHR